MTLYYLTEDSQVRPDHFYKLTHPKWWTQKLELEFAKYATEEYPNEACAFIINNELVKVANISNNPTEEFELTLQDSLLYIKAQGFIHSHPNGPYHPSATDMQAQMNCKIPFGIMTCTIDSASTAIWIHDDNLNIPLQERPFVHGIFDCYEIPRAYMWQSKKIKLPQIPRDNEWWNAKKLKEGGIIPAQNLYLENFEKAGYKVLGKDDELKEGDGILMNIQTNVVSHAGIYLGNGLILHHLRDRISKIDHAASWKKYFHTVVRYGE